MFKNDLKCYLSEVFSSIQGEGGSVRGSCFGKRQIFLRFAGCNLAQGSGFNSISNGCFWCDSLQAQDYKLEHFKCELTPGSQEIDNLENPVDVSKVISIINNLITPDLHSISFTGGEPLIQLDFILRVAKELREINLNIPLYLETNGTILPKEKKLKEITRFFEYCCCDIKDRSSFKVSEVDWKRLIDTELNFINLLIKNGVKTFAKLVATQKTQLQDVKWICEKLSKIIYNDGNIVGLAIQPVTIEDLSLKEHYAISNSHLNEIFYTAAEFLPPESLTLSIQAHKYLKLL